MKINVQALSRTPGAATRVEIDSRDTNELLTGYLGQALESVEFSGDLIHLEHGRFRLSGRIKAMRTGECDRCLKPARNVLELDVSELYTRQNTPEYKADSDEYYGYAGHTIEIDPAIRDNLLMNLPLQLLCRDDCPGFCPGCGRDLSEGVCDCIQEAVGTQSPFSKLSKLLQDKDDVLRT